MAKPKNGAPKKGKKGSRKFGRNKIKCTKYLQENRREKNKARRAAKRQNRLDKAAAKRA